MKLKIKNLFCKIICTILSAVAITCTCLSLTSCAPPKIEEVKEIFAKLIDESVNVNQILFGEGLSIYGSMSYNTEHDTHYSIIYTKNDGKLCVYYDKEKKENISLRYGKKDEPNDPVYVDDKKGIYLYKSNFVNKDPSISLPELPNGYNLVRFDERCTTINEIAELASKVYSEEYLAAIFESIMGSYNQGQMDIDNPTFAKYIEFVDTFDNKKYLLKADESTYPTVTNEQRIYDYDTMKIIRPSKKHYVTIEISSYGTYIDANTTEIKTGWSTTKLNFVFKNSVWRLDSPTY